MTRSDLGDAMGITFVAFEDTFATCITTFGATAATCIFIVFELVDSENGRGTSYRGDSHTHLSEHVTTVHL